MEKRTAQQGQSEILKGEKKKSGTLVGVAGASKELTEWRWFCQKTSINLACHEEKGEFSGPHVGNIDVDKSTTLTGERERDGSSESM